MTRRNIELTVKALKLAAVVIVCLGILMLIFSPIYKSVRHYQCRELQYDLDFLLVNTGKGRIWKREMVNNECMMVMTSDKLCYGESKYCKNIILHEDEAIKMRDDLHSEVKEPKELVIF